MGLHFGDYITSSRGLTGPHPTHTRPGLRIHTHFAQTVDHLAQNAPKMPISTEVDCTVSTHHKSRT